VHAAEQLIRTLNQAWPAADLERVAACYHPDALLLPPDAGDPIVGRDAIRSTYRDFLDTAELVQFNILSVARFEFSNTETQGAQSAIHLRFEVDYRLDGDLYRDTGLETYWVDATPQILWRHQVIDSSKQIEDDAT